MVLNNTLKQDFNISTPKIAVLSLNPHAGDGGLLGSEEKILSFRLLKRQMLKIFMSSDHFRQMDSSAPVLGQNMMAF